MAQTHQQSDKEGFDEIITKLYKSQATEEQKDVFLKKLGASLKEFGNLIERLKESLNNPN